MKAKEKTVKDDFIGLSGPLWESWTLDEDSSGYHTTSTKITGCSIEFGILNKSYQGDQDWNHTDAFGLGIEKVSIAFEFRTKIL